MVRRGGIHVPDGTAPHPAGPFDPEERVYLVALSQVEGLGPVRLASLLRLFGSAREAWFGSAPALEESGLPPSVRRALLERRRRLDPFEAVPILAREGLAVVTSLDEDYPPGLRSLAGYPPVLYVRGEARTLRLPAVAVVGTRRPTPYGLEMTASIAAGLGVKGVVVVSGLAFGVDAEAHRAALRAGGTTVGVLGSGHRRLYPPRHNGLAGEMAAARGAVISQFGPDTLPRKGHFVARNRTVAGMVSGVVVTEAPEGSGALSTAAWATDLGRVVMAVPGPVTTRSYDGCLQLLRAGAVPVASADHVMTATGLTGVRTGCSSSAEAPCPTRRAVDDGRNLQTEEASRTGLSGEAAAVLAALGPGELVPFAMLAARTGLATGPLGAVLGVLEVRRLVGRQPGHCYVRLPNPRP